MYPYTHSFHINIPSSLHPYSNFILKFNSSIPVIFSFLFLLSSFLSLLLLLLLLPFSSLLSYPFLLSLSPKTKMRYLFLVLSLFDLIPFLFHFPRRKLPPSFLQATCLFHNFLPYFILISFFYYSLVLIFIFILNSIYQNPTLAYELIIL